MGSTNEPNDDLLSQLRSTVGLEHAILEAFDACFDEASSPLANALQLLVGRTVFTFVSIRSLCEHAHPAPGLDLATLLRASHESLLQAEYMCSPNDASARESLANLYLDYYWVEHHKLLQGVVREEYTNAISANMRRSANRAPTEAEIAKQLAALGGKYELKPGKYRDTWHGTDMRSMARVVGKSEEYEFFLRQYHSAVHTGPFASLRGITPRRSHAVTFAASFAGEGVLLAAGVSKTSIDPYYEALLTRAVYPRFLQLGNSENTAST